MRTVGVLASLLCALGATACKNGPPPDPSGLPCIEGTDCAVDGYTARELEAFCLRRFCVKQCRVDADCQAGSVCVAPGECSIQCATDLECYEEWECADRLTFPDYQAVMACRLIPLP